ncbi:MAG: hypothetical protein WCI34_04230 [Actinomycetes bacterium]
MVRRAWFVVPAVLLALVCGGCGGSSGSASTGATPTKTVTVTATAAAPESKSATSSFSGNGTQNLGDLRISSASTLSWRNDGLIFGVMTVGGDVWVQSQGHSGTTEIANGEYRSVKVVAQGSWSIKITPH